MKIAVTKLKEKSEGVHELFRRYGHEALVISTMNAAEPTDPAPLSHLSEMVSRGSIDILIFTSALGVDKVLADTKPAGTIRLVCVGPKTAQKVKEYGLSCEVIKDFSSDNFAYHLGEIRGKTIGIARAQVPNPELVESLTSKGAMVYEAPAYRLEPSKNDFAIKIRDADAVFFTSARSFEYSGFNKTAAENKKVIAIGQKTANAMLKKGVVPDIVGKGTIESCLSILK